ncbi:MAG: DUF4815 domain-containing protein, partial [Proteobacteria bacterium]|nr:DUF4815 domain-containing protein [Pseudomonadota bacterium]
MSIETNLNVAPYFDDYDELKDFHKVLFRPGVALQARELNQLQTILQKQVERFGDHIFKAGTIVSGINFQFNQFFSYVKIIDEQVDGQPVIPSEYVGLLAKNSANLISRVVNSKSGFQSQDPEMSYLYLRYLNSGSNEETDKYANSDVLTIYSDKHEIFDYIVDNGGSGFSNSDIVQISPALIVENSNIAVSANITQIVGATQANVFVKEVNTTFGSITLDNFTYTNTEFTILKVKPNNADLANASLSSEKWTISPNTSITQGSNTANVVRTIGAGATATLTTDAAGIATDVSVVNPGSNYIIDPHVTIKTTAGVLTALNITPQTFKAQVTVADGSFTGDGTTPVGNAYAFSVSEGIIFQKGMFLRVDSQTIVVNAYSSNVHNKTVGFTSTESIVNSSIDTSLFDNATGTSNFAATGANRLKIVPQLTVIDTANVAANSTFFPLVEFREGEPYKQNRNTSYNVIQKEFNRRTHESAGDYVLDKFETTSRDKPGWSNTHIDLVVDPGVAYLGGERIETLRNTYYDIRRSTDTEVVTDRNISFNYGNYIFAYGLAGTLPAASGIKVDIQDTAKNMYAGNGATAIAAAGTKIGEARIRSVVLDSGIAGTTTAKYRVYLFDIRMFSGKNFRQARSLFSSSPLGIVDVITELDSATNTQIARLHDNRDPSLVFPLGVTAVKQANNTDYTYRTSNTSANISSTGILTITIGDNFPYGNNTILTAQQREELLIVPAANITSTNTEVGGTLVNSDATLTISTTQKFKAGDFIKVHSAANTSRVIHTKIDAVTNSTSIEMGNTWPFTGVSDGVVARFLPANIPVPVNEDRVSANTNSTGKTLSVNLSNNASEFIPGSATTTSITFTAKKENAEEIHKNVKRGLLIKIDTNTHPNGLTGPWCLGIPDVFRLNKVYSANAATVNTASADITRIMFVNNGQNNDYYGLASLNLIQQSEAQLKNGTHLLVEVDAFTLDSPTDAGYFSVESYDLAQNNSSRAELGNTAINIVEIPEYTNNRGDVVDCRDILDFRPRVEPTANITSTASLATTNPATTETFGAHEKLFPVPDSTVELTFEYYKQRVDRVILTPEGEVEILEGAPSDVGVIKAPPAAPRGTMSLAVIEVPPYPTVPRIADDFVYELGLKRTGTDGIILRKASIYTVKTKQLNIHTTQPRRYSMKDIGKLERRLEDLEYYTSLNLLEKKTAELTIPSSLDPAINRFKNGFFAENFNDYLQADVSNPDFKSHVNQRNGVLEPQRGKFPLELRFNLGDATTRANARFEGTNLQDSPLDWGEATLMLPIVEEVTIVNQDKFTSPVSGVGTDTVFVGDMVVKPSKMKVSVEAE